MLWPRGNNVFRVVKYQESLENHEELCKCFVSFSQNKSRNAVDAPFGPTEMGYHFKGLNHEQYFDILP
jgi:hypothetical protein